MNKNTGIFLSVFFLLFISCPLFAFQAQDSNTDTDTLVARQFLQKEKELKASGAYTAALGAVENARVLYAKHNLWEDVVKCEVRLAQLADNFETPDLKVKHANRAVDLAIVYLAADHLLLGSAYRQKAESLMMLGKLDSANYFLNRAAPICEEHKEWEELGWVDILIAVNHLNEHRLDSCALHLDKVSLLLLQKQTLPEKSRAEIQPVLLKLNGVLYQLQGDYDKAIQNTRQALAIDLDKEIFLAADSVIISTHYNNLGAFYLAKGDYQRSLDNFLAATYGEKDYTKDPILLYNIGQLFIKQERYAESITYFERILNVPYREEHQEKIKADAFNGLCTCFEKLTLYDKALVHCKQALDFKGNTLKYISWLIMGNIYIGKKQPQKALEMLDIATASFFQDATATKHKITDLSQLYFLRGEAHVLNQNPPAALQFYQKALIANHSNFKDSINYEMNPSLAGIRKPIYFLKTMQAKAKALSTFTNQSAKIEAALQTYELTTQWIDTLQVSYNTETSQLDWSTDFKEIYGEAIALAHQQYQKTQDPKYLELAFSFSEKSKNAILLETLKSNEGKSQAGIPDSLIQKEKDLNLNIVFYEKKIDQVKEDKDTAKIKLYQKYLTKSRLNLVDLREQLEKDYPKFYDLKYGGESTSIATVQSKLLDENAALLEYFIGDSTAFVFVITKDSATILPLDSSEKIKHSVTDFRKVLLDPAAFRQNAKAAFSEYAQKATAVYEQVLQKPLAVLPQNINQLIIVPDGVLNTVPFEALVKATVAETSEGFGFDFSILPYVLYDFQLHYSYSANLLLKNQAQRERLPTNITCLAFAPSYEGSQMADRGDLGKLRTADGNLEGTAKELQQIAHFVKGQFDFGTTATEQRFKQLADQFGILHLAMHGTVDLENANFNHLKFSNVTPDTLEDNLLHHYEIANMDLQAQLVVLSACETGVGKYEEGEGVFSLARSFMYAGVPSIVMSLWKVSDASTSKLMPYFYENLTAGASKDKALHEAKKRFLQEAGVGHRHPFYWSAFVVMGDAQELKQHSGHLLWWGMGVLILGIVGLFFLSLRPPV